MNLKKLSADSPIHLSLSIKGRERLEGGNHEKEFAFIVGDERYSCPSLIAQFLSPRGASLTTSLRTSRSTNFQSKLKIQLVTFNTFCQLVSAAKFPFPMTKCCLAF
jgi:hypothetical protein